LGTQERGEGDDGKQFHSRPPIEKEMLTASPPQRQGRTT